MKRLSLTLCIFISAILLVAGCSKKEKEMDSLGSIEGIWNGTINIPNQPLLVSFTFTKEDGTISIPSQGLQKYPLASVELKGSDLVIQMTLPGQQITIDGSVEKDKVSGTFTQQGQSFPLQLTKGSTEETPDTGEAVQIDLEEGKMTGVLEVPKGDGPFPLMVIIAGSGPTDHNGNSPLIPGKNNSLKMLAEELADKGVASIRFDKRGVGENQSLSGNEENILFDDFINDAAAWVQFAKNDNRFSKVGIIGHSEGSLIGMVAAEKTDADSFISIAGAGRSIDQVLLEQLEPQLPVNLLKESDDILQKLKKGEQVEKISPELQSLFRPSAQPYMISWLKYDPVKELQKLSSPVLIINGTRDFQVPVADAEQLHDGKKDSKLVIIQNMNHILKEAPEDQVGNLATYMDPTLPLAKGLMDEIIDFLK
ncbi:alpha/beta fold hydrolase [Sporosarcina sp. FSL W8-0480]|uniref:alpha/beta hydrolase family protein n=1 Tax=Sporosarcina sp. FSL W8-0480 TaxID=2954701 RepID=UPI0030D761A3